MVGLSLMLYRHDILGLPVYAVGTWLTASAAVLTLYSMLLYLQAAWPYLIPGAPEARPECDAVRVRPRAAGADARGCSN